MEYVSETKSEYLILGKKKRPENKKTDTFDVNNKQGSTLGEIKYYANWRKYCYFPTVQAVYDQKCLGQITKWLEELNRK